MPKSSGTTAAYPPIISIDGHRPTLQATDQALLTRLVAVIRKLLATLKGLGHIA